MKAAKEIAMFIVALIILTPVFIVALILALIACVVDRRYPDHERGS